VGSANQKEPVASAANTSDDAEERHSKVNPNMPPPILVRESMPPVKMLTRTIAALGHRAGCVDDAKRQAAAAFIIRLVLTLNIPGVPTDSDRSCLSVADVSVFIRGGTVPGCLKFRVRTHLRKFVACDLGQTLLLCLTQLKRTIPIRARILDARIIQPWHNHVVETISSAGCEIRMKPESVVAGRLAHS